MTPLGHFIPARQDGSKLFVSSLLQNLQSGTGRYQSPARPSYMQGLGQLTEPPCHFDNTTCVQEFLESAGVLESDNIDPPLHERLGDSRPTSTQGPPLRVERGKRSSSERYDGDPAPFDIAAARAVFVRRSDERGHDVPSIAAHQPRAGPASGIGRTHANYEIVEERRTTQEFARMIRPLSDWIRSVFIGVEIELLALCRPRSPQINGCAPLAINSTHTGDPSETGVIRGLRHMMVHGSNRTFKLPAKIERSTPTSSNDQLSVFSRTSAWLHCRGSYRTKPSRSPVCRTE